MKIQILEVHRGLYGRSPKRTMKVKFLINNAIFSEIEYKDMEITIENIKKIENGILEILNNPDKEPEKEIDKKPKSKFWGIRLKKDGI